MSVKLPIVLRPEASAEFNDAFDWYEDRKAGLGPIFAGSIQESFDRIAESPGSYEVVFDDIHRVVIRQFPFTIYYQIDANQILVLAIFHGKRDPAIWQSRA